MMREISGLRDIARDFDAMLIDQFGVIHDGQKLYQGAAEVLAELHRLGVPVIVMTKLEFGGRVSFKAINPEFLIKFGE